ncbi:MAG: NUDIX hydrolase [Bacteroidales bacterium]
MNNYFATSSGIQLFKNQLRAELALEMPGTAAHLRLAPEMRIEDIKTGRLPAGAVESAVLILLYPKNVRLHTVVILRNEYDGVHSGQISLPGGKKEQTDIDFKATALREAQEEIGIIPEKFEVLGQLSPFYVRPSNFIIYPFIAFQKEQPEFHRDPTEVQRIIEIDLQNETTYENIEKRTLTFKNNFQVIAPGFVVGNEFMWGATAMIFSELIHVLKNMTDKKFLNIT